MQLGDLVAIDGTLIDAVCSMTWADYSSTTKKAKLRLGFDVNRGIPGKVCLTDGKGDESPLVPRLLAPGQTGIMDRNYQCYRNFDLWQEQGLLFVCRIKAGTIKTCLETYALPAAGPVFNDAQMRLGSPRANQPGGRGARGPITSRTTAALAAPATRKATTLARLMKAAVRVRRCRSCSAT